MTPCQPVEYIDIFTFKVFKHIHPKKKKYIDFSHIDKIFIVSPYKLYSFQRFCLVKTKWNNGPNSNVFTFELRLWFFKQILFKT